MAFSHIQFNDQLPHGTKLRRGLSNLEEGLDGLNKIRDTMTLMIDGDGSNSTQFAEATTRFGFPDNASAKAAWDELNSLLGKLNSDADQTSVHTAMTQAFSKLR